MVDDIEQVAADPRLDVPPVPVADAPATLSWLRQQVPRFRPIAGHARPRALTEAIVAQLDPDALRQRAAQRTRAATRDTPLDLLAEVARPVPLGVLAEALGAPDAGWRDAATLGHAYLPPEPVTAAADAAVGRLVVAFGGVADEPTAHRIGLLAQAADATAALIGAAARHLLSHDTGVARAIAAALRTQPPVRAIRRQVLAPVRLGGVDRSAGEIVRLDLAGRPWGVGGHACPGQAIAVALTAGVLDGLTGLRLLDRPDGLWIGA